MSEEPDLGHARAFGARVDFGRAANDYRTHRAGFPEAFFQRLAAHAGLKSGLSALDVGTGTGTVARGLAGLGLNVIATDPSEDMLAAARGMADEDGLAIDFRTGRAEHLEFADSTFDVITAGQCWHWFDRDAAAAEAYRALRPGGVLVIAHFDWLPLPGNVVAATEAMILDANPAWKMGGGRGVHPAWLTDMSVAGFRHIETASYDVDQPYTHKAWRGRIRASAGVKASLSASEVAAFDKRLGEMLAADFPADPLLVPHRVWWALGRR